jgi:hypothetical protein
MNKEMCDESIHGGCGRFGGWPPLAARRARTGIGNVGADQSEERHRHHAKHR